MMATADSTSEREIVTTRIFDAPRELVWRMWTQPEHTERWWGPSGFTTTTKEFDLRPGGVWLFTMHGPDGTNYRNDIAYTDVVEFQRLEWDHGPSPQFHVTVTFADEAVGRTMVVMQMLFPTAQECTRTIEKFGALEGQRQTMQRLEEYLADQTGTTATVSKTA